MSVAKGGLTATAAHTARATFIARKAIQLNQKHTSLIQSLEKEQVLKPNRKTKRRVA